MDFAELLRTIFLEGVALALAPDQAEAKERYFSLCQRAIVEAQLRDQEMEVRAQQLQQGREEVEAAQSRARAAVERVKFLERQVERHRQRADSVQAQLDEIHRARIAAGSSRLGTTSAKVERLPDVRMGAEGDAAAQVLDLQRKLRTMAGECEALRERERALAKENEKLMFRQQVTDRESQRVQEQLRIDREGRGDTNEKLKLRIRELEDHLRSMCAVQVRQQQQSRRERERKMWEKLERETTTRLPTATSPL